MAIVLVKLTMSIMEFAHTPDYQGDSRYIVNPDLSAVQAGNVPGKYWKLDNNKVVEMSPAEKAEVDGELLVDAMAYVLKGLESSIRLFIEERYPAHKQRNLSLLLSDAMDHGLTNRAAYIQQAWDWISDVTEAYNTEVNRVNSMTSKDDVVTHSFDRSKLGKADPKVTVEAARQIQD